MEDEIRVRGKLAERVRDFCTQHGKESPSECLELLLNLATKKSSASSNISLKKIYNKVEGATCRKCGKKIDLGELSYYDPDTHTLLCAKCFIDANAGKTVTEESVKSELKLREVKEQIKVLEKEKERLMREIQVLNVFEKLEQMTKEWDEARERFIKTVERYGFSSKPEDREKVIDEIRRAREMIERQNSELHLLAVSLLKTKRPT